MKLASADKSRFDMFLPPRRQHENGSVYCRGDGCVDLLCVVLSSSETQKAADLEQEKPNVFIRRIHDDVCNHDCCLCINRWYIQTSVRGTL
jgi:hypothetical protein